MQIKYKLPDATVNVSKVSPLKRGVQLFAGLLLTVVVLYLALGLLVNLLAPYVPRTLEDKLGQRILSKWTVEDDDVVVERYEDILDKLVGEDVAAAYAVRVIDMDEINAFAIPGNIIAFSSEFVKSVEDEEAIAFVLGHELGHFQNRDHIKGYGRGMVLYLMASLVAGEDSSTSAVFLDILNKTEMKFSQKAELSADAYGATLLYSAYGRYDGAVALFEMFSEEYDHGKMAAYFDSHPHPEIRIEAIKSLLEGIQ